MDKGFYRAFEDHFRGPRDLIKSRLRVYLPFIIPLKDIYKERKVIDLGCGRGEWLELMAEAGFEAHGIDLDESVRIACDKAGLSVTRDDAVEYLTKLQDESVVIVSGFHIIEHISFADLQKLVTEAFRVLKPGGLLILETPNPENLVVATTSFYLDPTHQRPIPPSLLYFLAEYCGFSRVKLLRLQEPASISGSEDLRLMDLFTGVSPDYAVVAQKNAPNEHLRLFDSAFEKEYGLTMDDLALHYERRNQQLMAAEHELQSVYRSRCWRITAPLRITFDLFLRVKTKIAGMLQALRHKLGAFIAPIMSIIICFAIAHPALKSRAMAAVRRYPRFDSWFCGFIMSRGFIGGNPRQSSNHIPSQISDLSPEARRIYAELKAAIETNRRSN